ncbi:MAG: branched-chain amino acid ABC transporter permease [Hyphomicrobiales bacterium]|nr:branched-chain amino acid ABC transporter permease [Hyphomicrobiales bacterium]
MMRPEFFAQLRSPVPWIVLAVAAVMPFVLPNYYLHIFTITLVYAALASAWNIVGGIAGQISLAHSLFVGCGAMLSSALLVRYGLNMWLGVIVSAAAAAAIGAMISFIDFRFRLGHLSFALITMAFAEMAEIYVTGTEFFGGASGLFLPKDTGDFFAFQFGGGRGAFWAMLAMTALCLLANLAILNSPLGYYLRSIRDNENAAQAIGVGLLRNKTLAMTISAVLTAIVGAIYARYLAFVDPYLLVSPTLTVEIILFATVGGLGSVIGPALGAFLLAPLGEILRGHFGGSLPGLHYFIYGAIVVAVILVSPAGVWPAIVSRLAKRGRQKA